MAQSVAFEALAQLRGRIYVAERNRFFQNQQEVIGSVQTYLQSDNWQIRTQARILQGWVSEHAFYTNLIAQLDAVNFERERKTAVGISRIWDMYALRAQQEYQHKVLPLCWEVVTKQHADLPAWKVVTFLHMIGAVPTEESIEPVVYLLEESSDPLLRAAAGQTLAKLPREAVKGRLSTLEGKHRDVLQAIQSVRDRF
jgi:hypothetical protein